MSWTCPLCGAIETPHDGAMILHTCSVPTVCPHATALDARYWYTVQEMIHNHQVVGRTFTDRDYDTLLSVCTCNVYNRPQ